ncbi:MAG: alpha/beta hydrolase [Cryomorphaceae bacterium]|nr:MAG: alpha/beta hydrolase [Cryomorphaceae bacterium]
MAQTPVSGTDCLQFEIPGKKGSIQFIQVGADTSAVLPALIFLQGSQPVPLIIGTDEYKHVVLPFDYQKVAEKFHLFVIAMPNTPVEAVISALDENSCFVIDHDEPNSYDPEYLRNNVLENYVERTHRVIDEIVSLNHINGQVHMAGHSQGAKIAAVVASENPDVKSVALLAFNAFGRYDERIRSDRHALKSSKISGEQYQQRLADHYGRWQHIQQDPDDYASGNNAWVSFSIDYLPFLLKTDIPLWVGYGTEDISAENCDLLPLHFISAGKENLQLKPYAGWDHNFFDNEGTMHWNTVMEDVVEWLKAVE